MSQFKFIEKFKFSLAKVHFWKWSKLIQFSSKTLIDNFFTFISKLKFINFNINFNFQFRKIRVKISVQFKKYWSKRSERLKVGCPQRPHCFYHFLKYNPPTWSPNEPYYCSSDTYNVIPTCVFSFIIQSMCTLSALVFE